MHIANAFALKYVYTLPPTSGELWVLELIPSRFFSLPIFRRIQSFPFPDFSYLVVAMDSMNDPSIIP
jgi:hypothetical protein